MLSSGPGSGATWSEISGVSTGALGLTTGSDVVKLLRFVDDDRDTDGLIIGADTEGGSWDGGMLLKPRVEGGGRESLTGCALAVVIIIPSSERRRLWLG